MLDGLAEAEDLEHRERDRVVGVREELLRAHRADPARERREHEDEMVAGKAGLDARRVQRRLAAPARVVDPGDLDGVEAAGIEEPGDRRRDDVDAAREHPAQVVDGLAGSRLARRRVADAVGLEREQLVGVARGGEPERCDADEVTRVAPGLGGVVDPHPDEVDVVATREGGDRDAADTAGRPLHHPSHHRSPSAERPWSDVRAGRSAIIVRADDRHFERRRPDPGRRAGAARGLHGERLPRGVRRARCS